MIVKPKGCDNPLIYVVTGIPHEEDFEKGYPLSGASGQYLLRILSAYDTSDSVRVVSMTPSDDAESLDYSLSYLISDLKSLKCKPKVIVTFSGDVTQAIFKERFTAIRSMQGQVYDVTIGGESYKVVPAYSPSYILEELRLASEEDEEGKTKFTTAPTEFARSMYVASCIAKDEYVDVLASKKMKYCLTFQEFFDTYFNDKYSEEETLSYDVETTADPIYDENLKIIGFSNARKDEGFYVCIEALDYKMTDEDREKSFSLLKDILVNQKVVVHNSMYERPLTLECVGYDIPYETLDDTLAMARLMLGGKVGAGLKIQAQTHCGYPNWEVDKDDFLDAARRIIVTVCDRFYDREKFPDLKSMVEYDSGCKWKTSFDEAVSQFKDICYKYYNIDETDNLLSLIVEKAYWYLERGRDVPKVLPYSFIPYRIICKYGACDAIATIDLRDHYLKWMKKESTDTVDLWQGYQVILKQMYAGYILERNGAYWNESIVQGRKEKWVNMATESLRHLIESPLIRDKVVESSYWRYLPFVLSEVYPEVAASQGYKVDYDKDTDKFKVFTIADGKRCKKDCIYDIKLNDEVYGFIYDCIMNDVKTADLDKLEEIYNPKSVKNATIPVEVLDTEDFRLARWANAISVYGESVRYNPKVRDLFVGEPYDKEVIASCHAISGAIDAITDLDSDRDLKWKYKKARIKEYNDMIFSHIPTICKHPKILSAFLNHKNILDEDLPVEEYNLDRITSEYAGYSFKIQIQTISDTLIMDELDDEYIRICTTLTNKSKLKNEFGSEWLSKRKELFDQFKTLTSVSLPHSPILLKLDEGHMESLDEDTIIKTYEVYQLTGIDADDQSTWTDRFSWLINYRIYKKIVKLLTSYVEGSVGHDSVVIVDEEELQSGKNLVIRKGSYHSRPAEVGEDYLMAASFGVATAETLRWKSGFHTIPWGSPVKKFYTSRYKGGTIVAPDYSQAEIRTLAASAKCEPMLDAFRNGADIHLRTASGIFNKPMDQILEVERRFSKMASFSILYGAKYEAFAANYLQGDVDRAKSIYDGFFAAFPEIKTWTEQRHQEYKDTGKVSALTNQFIVISPGGPENYQGGLNSALRKAGNYPIQCASSGVVGCTLYEICKYIARKGMKSKPFLFVHDSLEIDVHPDELIDLITEFRRLLADIPNKDFGLPSKAEFTMGFSLGHEHELSLWEPNEDRTEVHMILEGYEDELNDTIENWKKVYPVVDIIRKFHTEKVDGKKVEVEGFKPDYYSWDRLFILKRSYDEYVSLTRQHGKVELFLKIR